MLLSYGCVTTTQLFRCQTLTGEDALPEEEKEEENDFYLVVVVGVFGVINERGNLVARTHFLR